MATVFAKVRSRLSDSSKYPPPIRKFKSGAAVAKYFGKHSDRMLIHNEAGADRKAQQADQHYASMIAELTDAMTAFEQGFFESGGARRRETTAAACPDPSLMALMSSTNDILLSTFSSGDAGSGFLGRGCLCPCLRTLKFYEAQEELEANPVIDQWVARMETDTAA